MLAQDKALQALIAQLADDKYMKAFALINEVQSRINPLTGLGPEEYDIANDDEDHIYEPAAKDMPGYAAPSDLPTSPTAKLIKTLPKRKKPNGKK